MGGARRRNKRRFPEEFPGRNVCCQDDFLDAMDIQGQGRLGGCSEDAGGVQHPQGHGKRWNNAAALQF